MRLRLIKTARLAIGEARIRICLRTAYPAGASHRFLAGRLQHPAHRRGQSAPSNPSLNSQPLNLGVELPRRSGCHRPPAVVSHN